MVNQRSLVLLLSHVQLFLTLQTLACQVLLSMGFLGKNTGMSCHFFLQGIFQIQGSNPHLLHWQADSLPLSHQGSPSQRIVVFSKSLSHLQLSVTPSTPACQAPLSFTISWSLLRFMSIESELLHAFYMTPMRVVFCVRHYVICNRYKMMIM